MKKILLTLSLLMIVKFGFGQTNTFPATGKVGIGTLFPRDTTSLHIKGGHTTSSTLLEYPLDAPSLLQGSIFLKTWASEPLISWNGTGIGANVNNWGLVRMNNSLSSSYIRFIPQKTSGMMLFSNIDASGIRYDNTMAIINDKVGIGTTDPITKLTVAGTFTPAFMQVAVKNNTIGEGIGISLNEANNTRRGHIYAQNGNGLILGDETNYGLRVFSGGSEVLTARSNGNVGIGTTNPTSKFDVFGGVLAGGVGSKLEVARFVSTNGNSSLLRIFNNRFKAGGDWYSSSTRIQQTIDATDMGYLEFNPKDSPYGLAFGSYSGEIMRLTDAGNVGIGTTNPSQKLSVIGQGVFGSSGASSDPGDGLGSAIRIGFSTAGDYGYILANNTGIAGKNLILQSNGNGGNVGIGTLTPSTKLEVAGDTKITGNVNIGATIMPTNYKLAVGGDIIAERVVVKLVGTWPDYVFKKTYGLRPLEQVEQFINQNNHLPEVPSAQEVSDKGIDVGAINAKLLQKVEELTLYLIEQNKEIKIQINENEKQNNEINILKQELQNIKNKL